ncbi:MAG TPA: hypothetical protein DCL15_19845 [Chloroflexi bacterium]|nr:hypothetical protein [Chloroflexota bacterium]HHW85849.1 hypothetical protein [Chloroflexota bacterium]
MSTLPPGPYQLLPCLNAPPAPFYILPFDKRGICEAPATRTRLLEDVAAGRYTDIFIFSHGWNNDWPGAVQSYRRFIAGFTAMVQERQLALPTPFRPLLIGIHWPSAALTFGEEEAPTMAATGEALDAIVAVEAERLRDLAEALPAAVAARFYTLLQQPRLTAAETQELAQLVAPFYATADDELGDTAAFGVEDMVAAWSALAPAPDRPLGEFGIAGGGASPGAAADVAQFFDPRLIVRGLTVFQMKDRAGAVGAHGVGPLLRELLGASTARVHGAGHSYGCRVLLSAICFGETWPRPLHSLLLMQGALSHLAFAADVTGQERPGGYRRALDRVFLPLLCTFSQRDAALHRFYHLVLRRDRDVGEMKIAAAGEPPSRYAALGGYGPRGSGEHLINVLDAAAIDAGARYDLSSLIPIIGIDATSTIGGHGDYSNLSTYWMLYNLLTA